ncbi:MAG TPA: cytochrome B [Flavobacteriales bacterium]|nr:cytochrome B [Flavobacteriales bacterium]HIN40704.1 cytochrome B [Flavobacteriales bacterium]
METGILHFHSIWRYVVLLLILITIARSIQGWVSKAEFAKVDIKLGLFSMISLHIQLLTGFILYYLSDFVQLSSMGEAMKNPLLRFWTVEHITLMIIAVALITFGRKSIINTNDSLAKHRKTVIIFGIGLLLLFLAIPWPWSNIEITRPFFNF